MSTDVPWTISLHSCLPMLRTVISGGGIALKWASVCHNADHSDQIVIYNGHSRDLMSCMDSSEVDFICVHPKQLFSLLSISLSINWEKEYVHHETTDANGVVTAFFRDGTTVQGTVLVGCDGVHSQGNVLLNFIFDR